MPSKTITGERVQWTVRVPVDLAETTRENFASREFTNAVRTGLTELIERKRTTGLEVPDGDFRKMAFWIDAPVATAATEWMATHDQTQSSTVAMALILANRKPAKRASKKPQAVAVPTPRKPASKTHRAKSTAAPRSKARAA